MNRRTFLSTGGMAAVGAAIGCATNPRLSTAVRRAPVRLVPVRVAWDRIIRNTVGLRPHRDSGFVLRAEKLGDALLIHNYGHGGAGMSISWGTGSMAADLAMDQPQRRAAVIGSGAVGLTTARQLQRRGFDVTIFAMALPPFVTSSMSLAGYTPTSGLVERDRRTPQWDAQYRRAADIAYRQLQLLAGTPYGVSWVDQYQPATEIRPSESDADRLDIGPQPAPDILERGEHPFPTRYAIRRTTLRIEPSIYLDALTRDFLLFGGRVVIRKFDTPRDLMSVDAPVIVNCTGLGSRDLFGDDELVPLKGQLTVLMPQSDVNYQTSGGVNLPSTPGIGIHMMPRSDGIALGGTSQRGVWTMEPDEAERRRVVEGHMELFSRMSG